MRRSVKSDTVSHHSEGAQVATPAAGSWDLQRTHDGALRDMSHRRHRWIRLSTSCYHFNRFISSTLVEILPLNTTMMMAKPTAASPAAMAMMNRATSCPAIESK